MFVARPYASNNTSYANQEEDLEKGLLVKYSVKIPRIDSQRLKN